MENLSHRGITCSCFCPICDKAFETVAHALFHCDHAKLTWALWSGCPVDLSCPTCDPVDIILDITKRGTSHDLEIFFATAWSIWWNRCLFLPPTAPFPPTIKWKAPPPGFCKINVDGATSNVGSKSCIGMIVRDCHGHSIAAACEVLQSSYSAEITEAFALLHGVLLALDLRISHVIFESDALSIVQALNCGVADGEIGLILQDIRSLSASFSWCTFLHLKRDGPWCS
ncbi:uncharacterized protein LOC142616881 [Castanea sativa]|uniref:uncharacterized protein LOC142616881 n=1 Tax=Castanea sativa TaxID=21020 RepID=UPI003F64F93B